MQKPLFFTMIGGFIGTVGYFVGLIIFTLFILYVQDNPNAVPKDGDFNIYAFLLGITLVLIPRVRLYSKSKELIEHFDKIQNDKL